MNTEREQKLKALMLRSLEGDQEAYKRLLEQVSQMLQAYLMKHMSPAYRTPQRVEDMVQDILLAIDQKKASYRTEMALLPWIYAIARYRLIDSVRANSRRIELTAIENDDDFERAVFKAWRATQESPTVDLDAEEILGDLSERQKKVLIMAKVEELPLKEVADQMKMSISAVKVTVHRAIQNIRRKKGGDL